jgi:hypothetical protein
MLQNERLNKFASELENEQNGTHQENHEAKEISGS